jgi:putative NADH-flavin reductase
MNITIIGASAGIGFETVKRGLNRNHSITILSRSEIEIEQKESLTMILGDSTNKADVADFLIKQAEKQTALKKFISIPER